MIVTEEKAKTMFCPHFDKKCEASNCMAWEWHVKTIFHDNGPGTMPMPRSEQTNEGSCSKK